MRVRVKVGFILAALLVMATSAPPSASASDASASSFHQYTFATEWSEVSYVGARDNRAFASYGGVSCVYDPLWLHFDWSASHWIELGISHGCNVRPGLGLYAFLCDSTVCDFMYTKDITADGSRHLLTLERDYGAGGAAFAVRLDGNTLDVIYFDGSSVPYIDAGMESYDASAVIANQIEYNLNYKASKGGNWVYWTGSDAQTVDPAMCGGWQSEHIWAMGENATC